MSAEVLRRAAALMRERAFATEGALPIWYQPESTGIVNLNRSDAEFIAAMTPAVALAVADWLDAEFVTWQHREHSLSAASVRAMSGETNEPSALALAVATTYLNEEQP